MAQTITPVVHGGRRRRWGVSVALHALGATLSAAAFGAALGGLGSLLGAPWGKWGLWVAAAIAVAYAARELLGLKVPIPALRRQVPEWWRTFFSRPTASFLYGLGLGIGFLTYVSFGTLVAVSAVLLVLGDPVRGAVAMGAFGLARGLSVLVSAGAGSEASLDRVMARLDGLATSAVPRVANGAALIALSVALAVAAAWGVPASGAGGVRVVAQAVLAVVFAWAAIAKLAGFGRWRDSLRSYGIASPFGGAVAAAVPVAELAVPGFIAGGRPVDAAVLALGLLACFSIAIVWARRRLGTRLPCGCFGGPKRRDWRLMLARNAVLAAVAGAVAATGASYGTGARVVLPRPEGGAALPILLAFLGLAVVAWAAYEAVRATKGDPKPRARV